MRTVSGDSGVSLMSVRSHVVHASDGVRLRVYRSVRRAERDRLPIATALSPSVFRSRSPAEDFAPALPALSYFEQARPFADPRELEDRRRFVPDRRFRSAVTVGGTVASVVPRLKLGHMGRLAFGFSGALATMVCVRRKMRRQVLFAKKRAGGGHKRPRRGPFSGVFC